MIWAALIGIAHAAEPLRQVQAIALPDVRGCIDHLAVDLAGQRLFVAALGNDTIEVIDLRAGRRAATIRALPGVQGVEYSPGANILFGALDSDGSCRAFDGATLKQIGQTDLKDDADNVRYDAAARRIYVGYGDGGIGILDARSGDLLGDLPLPGHPESFRLETKGPRIFVNVPNAQKIVVISRETTNTVAEWPLQDARANFPMALDESSHRLFAGCRAPPTLLIYNTETGEEVARLRIRGDTDDIFYDATRKRIYASCGEGFIDVFAQIDADHYERIGEQATAAGARTSLFVPELDHLYLAVPRRLGQPCEVRVFAPQ